MKAKAWRLYGAADARLEDIELEGAGEEGIVVELVTNTICLSDYKGMSLGTGHKRVPRDIATRPTMLQEAKGLTASESGTVIMLFEFAGIVGMLASGWMTDRIFKGRAPRLCVFLMALTAGLFATFWLAPSAGGASAALVAAGFALYGPQALTGVTATNLATKSLTGTAIGFISLFSYVGVSVSGKLCGNLAQSTGGWAASVFVMSGVASFGALIFLTLWRTKAHNYGG